MAITLKSAAEIAKMRRAGRIVAEVLIGLLWNDHHSYVYQDPLWQPGPPMAPREGELSMSDLVAFTDA